jgi:hypothetical protein
MVDRRRHYHDVRSYLETATEFSANDLITYNLDGRQFAQDIIEHCDSPDLLWTIYRALRTISILDPTCGSGAFLFAALNILEPLYEACLIRMQAFVDDAGRDPNSPQRRLGDFRTTQNQAGKHPSLRYFILKSIVINNLHGVDIMDEAVEICKLRLFLKLVAQIDMVEQIEPLPDIDFNIRSGNALVGYATDRELKSALKTRFDFEGTVERIEDQAQDLQRLLEHFRNQQTDLGGQVTPADKAILRSRLGELAEELNWYLAGEYGVKKAEYTAWRALHRLFHWFLEFHGIMSKGGFDVIIGNPPYVEYSQVRSQYRLLPTFDDYLTNLYAACSFRATKVTAVSGRFSFIVPVSLPSTDRMQPLRDLLLKDHAVHHVSFSTRPSKLFDGAEQRLTIFCQSPGAGLYSGGYIKWYGEERASLFAGIEYSSVPPLAERHNLWPKIGGPLPLAAFRAIMRQRSNICAVILGPGEELYSLLSKIGICSLK